MVSSSHEVMHRIFQEDPGLFARAFRALDIPFPAPVRATPLSVDVTETLPLERRIDTLLRLETSEEGPEGSFLLAVESQGRPDPKKPRNWLYYTAYLEAKHELPVVLLVVCQDATTARWASGPFRAGLPQWRTASLRPLVLGPDNVPVITDPDEAAQDVPLAVFAAITHGRHPRVDAILKALASALNTVDEEQRSLFVEMTELGLSRAPAVETWRNIMAVDLSFFTSETSQRLREEGRVEGRAEGRVEGRVEDTLRVLAARGVELSLEERATIAGCRDLGLLDVWFGRALTARSAAEVLAPVVGEADDGVECDG